MMVGIVPTPEPILYEALPVQFEVLSQETTLISTEPEIAPTERCSCVSYARELGLEFPRIRTPADLKPNSMPFVGAIILIDYPKYPHMGVIADIRPGAIIYKERRLANGECITSMNWIDFDDSKFRGIHNPVGR